jgi:virginiamycin A acetyltransferase
VPPYAVMGGNPARMIRMRFPDDVIAELLQIRWWDWDADKISRNLGAIRGSDLAALRRAA